MPFVPSEEQDSIRRTARAFVAERLPIAHLRALRDTADATGFSRDAWTAMAGLGFSGIVLPTRYGGAGLGYSELGIILEECGRALAPTPLFSTLVLGAGAVLLGGSDAQKERLLPGVSAGTHLLSLAHEEGARHSRTGVATKAEPDGSGYRVTGTKVFVHDGHVADTFIVSARTSGGNSSPDGITLLLVEAGAPGVSIDRRVMLDSRNAASVRFEGAYVAAAETLGHVERGIDVLDPLFDRAAIAMSAEMLGALSEAFERTVAYLKVRKQFGVPIGTFQGLKHRAAAMFCEVELTRSVVMEALSAIDEDRSDVPILSSAAKARASDAFLLIANEAIQMHGGIGVTDDLDIGFFLKRARVSEVTLGTSAYHRDRFAELQGY